jgi:hypothetical protein
MARPKADKANVKRVQLDMTIKSVERLRHLQEVTEAQSYAEVLRNALKLYEALINEVEAGNEIYLKRGDIIAPYPVFSS